MTPPQDQRLARAMALHRAGDLAAAAQLYREILQAAPCDFDAANLLGAVLLRQDNAEEALAMIERALAIDPQSLAARLNRGYALAALERLDEAAESFQWAIVLQPDFVEAHSALATVAAALGRHAEAAESWRRAIELQPGAAETHHNLGLALAALGENEEAAAGYRKALDIDPDFGEAHDNLGVALARLGRLDEAVLSHRRAVELGLEAAAPRNNLGAALSKLGRHRDAAEEYRRAIALAPDNAEACNNLGNALAELGEMEAAVASFRRATELMPFYAVAHLNLGAIELRNGRHREAELSFRRALAIEPGHAEAHNGLGHSLSAQGQFKAAVGEFEYVVEVTPRHFDGWVKLGAAQLKSGGHHEAEASFRRALTIDPDNADALGGLGHALLALRQFEAAITPFHRLAEINPDAGILIDLGTAQVRSHQIPEAELSFRRALAIDPDNAIAHTGLAVVLAERRQTAEVLMHCERAVRLQPDYAEAHHNLGLALKFVGRIEEGRQEIEKAIALDPRRYEFYVDLATSAKRFTADDPHLAAMESLVGDPALTEDNRRDLHFALGKALADAGRHQDAFTHLLAGNALKRAKSDYDERAALGSLERIRAAFTPELIRDRADRGDPSTVPVFVFGMPRSGTTLVEQILASHPAVHGAGELPDFGELATRLLNAETAGAEWQDRVRRLSAGQLRRLGGSYVERLTKLAPKARRITDKLPGNFSLAGLIHLALPNARLIHTRRDPVDTCLSCFSIHFGDQPMTYDLGELGRYYRAYQRLMRHWREVLPTGVMLEVDYEEVVADLDGEARRIVAHCGLDWDARCLAFYKAERPVWTASVNQVRQPIYRDAIGRWRPYKDMLGPLLAELRIAPDAG